MDQSIIEQVFLRRLVETALIVVALIGVFFFIRWAVREAVLPKWSYFVWAFVSLIIVVVLSMGICHIVLDMTEKDYITYQGSYIERGGGQQDLKTVVVYDEEGNEIRLLRNGASETGEFEGTVVYGKRSKIVVEYSGVPKE